MNLYVAQWEIGNQVDDWMCKQYVVADSYGKVEEQYPQSLSIKLIAKNIKIL